MNDKPVFLEKQYLGREFIPITVRLVLALICFAAYFFTEERELNGDLLLVVGFGIIIISIVLGFMLQFRTRVQNKSLLLDGAYTSRLVKIDLNSIVSVKKSAYSAYIINNPVYNLHKKGTVRFYAGGKDAVYLTDRDGLVYIIGSQHASELERVIKTEGNL
ncbi:MAG: hypothetical protein ACOH2A_08315 [Sphingobacteriaceae bacterium]